MTNAELLAETRRIGAAMPAGFGYYCVDAGDGVPRLLALPIEPPAGPPGQVIFVARRLPSGGILKAAVVVADDATPERLEALSSMAVTVLDARAKALAATWN